MLFDERIANLIARKYQALDATKPPFPFEVARFVRWLFEEDLTRPYLVRILRSDDAEWEAYAHHLTETEARAKALRDRLVAFVPNYASVEVPPAPDLPGIRMFDALLKHDRSPAQTRDELDQSPFRDQSRAHALIESLLVEVGRLSEPNTHDPDALQALRREIRSLNAHHEYAFAQQKLRVSTSPARSLRVLLEGIRALAPPPDGVPDWIGDLLVTPPGRLAGLRGRILDQGPLGFVEFQTDLARLYVEIMSVVGTSLSTAALVSRFKERCTWYGKQALRRVAADSEAGGAREDRLTLELARYLHDNGVVALVRPRVSNLEPDAVALGNRRLVIESKVWDSGAIAAAVRSAVRKGFAQLHAYMTTLETKAIGAEEGYLVLFRLGGPLCEVPPSVFTERFHIHIVPIDLGLAGDSGHAQPTPVAVTRDALIEGLSEAVGPQEA